MQCDLPWLICLGWYLLGLGDVAINSRMQGKLVMLPSLFLLTFHKLWYFLGALILVVFADLSNIFCTKKLVGFVVEGVLNLKKIKIHKMILPWVFMKF